MGYGTSLYRVFDEEKSQLKENTSITLNYISISMQKSNVSN